MVIRQNKSKGFIAIVSLLIITTIAMLFAMSMLKEGVDNASLSLSSIFYEDARINAISCMEDVFLRIRQEEQFSQNLDYALSSGNSCSTAIQWFAPQQAGPGITTRLATLDVTGVSNGFSRTFRYGLKIYRFDVNYSDGSLAHMNTLRIDSLEELST
ncbi:hypothetical protein JXA05_04020 [Candidatus Peregrinibacteria bacterium]|nr:hypothetical protein [Candidatus Peregrinibacteria bacterium]